MRQANGLRWLDEAERARWNRFRHPRPQRQFVLCRSALRALLCERIGCHNAELAFVAGEHGKPEAFLHDDRAPASFNVSHSGDHGLIALAHAGRLGIDIEERRLRHDIDGSIATVFSPSEREALANADGRAKAALFFKLWTLREALIKALGTGFSIETSAFEIPPSTYLNGQTGIFRFPHLPAVEWQLDDLGTPEFAAAIAQERRCHHTGPP